MMMVVECESVSVLAPPGPAVREVVTLVTAALAQGRGQPPGPLMAAASSAARPGLASRSPLFPAAAAESSARAGQAAPLSTINTQTLTRGDSPGSAQAPATVLAAPPYHHQPVVEVWLELSESLRHQKGSVISQDWGQRRHHSTPCQSDIRHQ